MTDTGTLHPTIGAESKTRWLLTGLTYKHRFSLASWGWIPAQGWQGWWFDSQDASDGALKYARSLRGTRIAKRFVAVTQTKMAI